MGTWGVWSSPTSARQNSCLCQPPSLLRLVIHTLSTGLFAFGQFLLCNADAGACSAMCYALSRLVRFSTGLFAFGQFLLCNADAGARCLFCDVLCMLSTGLFAFGQFLLCNADAGACSAMCYAPSRFVRFRCMSDLLPARKLRGVLSPQRPHGSNICPMDPTYVVHERYSDTYSS